MVRTSPTNARLVGSDSDGGAILLHASQPKNRNIKYKQYCKNFKKDFENGLHKNFF